MREQPPPKASGSSDLVSFLDGAAIRPWPKRTVILRQGDACEKFYFIVKGWVKLYSLTQDGEEILHDVLGAGNIVGDVSFLYWTTNRYFAVALDNVELGEMPAAYMRALIAKDLHIAEQLIAVMTRRIYSLQIEHGNFAKMCSSQRLSCLLLRLSSWMQGSGGSFTLPYDKSIVAGQLGMEPATLSRTLTKLEGRGVTCSGAEVKISDFATLSEYCCQRCPVPEGECRGRRTKLVTA